MLIARLERHDKRKSTTADYAVGKFPGSGSKTLAEERFNLSTNGLRKTLAERLDKYNDQEAAEDAASDSNVLAAPNEGASDPLPESDVHERDEIDDVQDIARSEVLNDIETNDPVLEPGDFDGVDQEELIS